MANPTILVSSLLLLAAALAGCSGDDGKSDATSLSTQTNVGNTTVSGSVSVGPDGGAAAGSVNGTEGNVSIAESWSYDNRSGTVSGTGYVVNVPIEKEESFTVADNTSTLFLNLSVVGEDLTMSVRAPDCETEDCAEEVTTQSGEASLQLNDPMAGGWIAVLQLEGNGPVEADYTLEIAHLAPGSSA